MKKALTASIQFILVLVLVSCSSSDSTLKGDPITVSWVPDDGYYDEETYWDYCPFEYNDIYYKEIPVADGGRDYCYVEPLEVWGVDTNKMGMWGKMKVRKSNSAYLPQGLAFLYAILFYESGGVWYSTEFIGVTGSLRFAVVQSFFVIGSSISLALCGNFAGAFYSLGYIGCTFAGIFREKVGNSYEDVMSKIRQLGHGLYVKLPGNYSYVDGIVKLLTGARTHQIYLYSLFKRNCAHYIEYLLQRSPDCQVRFVVRHQLTPIKLGRDLALRQYFYYFYRMYGIDLIGLGL